VGRHIINGGKPKSLYFDKKRAEAERIDEDNIRLLKKITTIEPSLNQKSMAQHWSA